MNDYKSVRNRLFTNSEVELKSELVELGIADDLAKQKKKLDGLGKKFNKALDRFNSTLAMARQEYAPIQKEYQTFLNEVQKYDAQGKQYLNAIKELGLNTNSQKLYQEGTFKAISSMFKGDFDRATKQVNGIKRK